MINTETENIIIQEYSDGKSINKIHKKYFISHKIIKEILRKNNIEENWSGRFSQEYIIDKDNNYAKIRIKTKGNFIYTLIDIDDVDRCKDVGIWSLTKDGYIINCKSGIYLHRYVMSAEKGTEVDHIYHDLLDNRKTQLRFATSQQQKFNTKKRVDNSSGHRGVYYSKERNKWCVNIKNGDTRVAKRFKEYQEAVEFCDMILSEWHREFKYEE